MAGANFTQVVKGNSTVKVDSSDYYVLVLANNGGSSPADVLYQFATYSANSTGEAYDVRLMQARSGSSSMRQRRVENCHRKSGAAHPIFEQEVVDECLKSGFSKPSKKREGGTLLL